jgi:small subunit ribosomal protein S8
LNRSGVHLKFDLDIPTQDLKEDESEKFPILEVQLRKDGEFKFTRISKPGRRIYTKFEEIKPVLSGLGIAVISTSAGFLTNKEARDKKIGGEVICEVY